MRARKENETLQEYHDDLKAENNALKARKFGTSLLYRTEPNARRPYVKETDGPIGTVYKTGSQKREEKRDAQ